MNRPFAANFGWQAQLPELASIPVRVAKSSAVGLAFLFRWLYAGKKIPVFFRIFFQIMFTVLFKIKMFTVIITNNLLRLDCGCRDDTFSLDLINVFYQNVRPFL